ncbi:DNA mismatch endonuclease (patch repair protein) [Bradyrhizobium japonicum]
MADVLTPEQRRLNMSRVRAKNTKPETTLRSALHLRGLRFRIHRKDLPGSPDIVFPRHKIAIFIDGCFWHGCPKHGVRPSTNRKFWVDKIEANRKRDKRASRELRKLGWKVIRIWEHDVKRDVSAVLQSIQSAVFSAESN